jgi:PAS domain S-box-containing protein
MSPPPAATRRLSVLIVEDVEDDAILDIMVLEDAGYTVHWQRVQDEREMKLALAARAWDLVLCDHALPRFSSLAALRTLTGADRLDTPMIVVSGAIGEETAAAVIRDGAADFVNKNNLRRLPTVAATALRQARSRRAAAHTEAQFHSAFDDAPFPSAVIKLRAQAGRLLRVNRALCDATGLSRTQLKRTPLPMLVDRKDRETLEGALRSIAEGATAVNRAEMRVHTATGELRWFLFSLSAVRDEGRRSDYAVAQFIDVTLRKEAEEALELAREQALEASRMKSEFVATVSHDLRTPLTAIDGWVQILLGGEPGPVTDEQRQFLGTVQRNSERLMRLVEQLLLVRHMEAGDLSLDITEVDVAALARETAELIHSVAEAKHVSVTVAADDVAIVRGERARLSVLLSNLTDNAIKFTSPEGTVAIEVSRRDGVCRLTVTDSGIGIPPGERTKVFDRFYRTSTATAMAAPGTGLGLAISKTITESHDGSIYVADHEGPGAMFVVELPAAPGEGTRHAQRDGTRLAQRDEARLAQRDEARPAQRKEAPPADPVSAAVEVHL